MKTIMITGASSGIGKATALRFRAGSDAEALLDRRKQEDDATFLSSIKQLMRG